VHNGVIVVDTDAIAVVVVGASGADAVLVVVVVHIVPFVKLIGIETCNDC
jgi:hypothetical protein